MCVSREVFLQVTARRTVAEAARKLGIRPQSVQARLDRIRLGDGLQRSRHVLSNAELESAWHTAHENHQVGLADDLFAEMCDRTERKVRGRK